MALSRACQSRKLCGSRVRAQLPVPAVDGFQAELINGVGRFRNWPLAESAEWLVDRDSGERATSRSQAASCVTRTSSGQQECKRALLRSCLRPILPAYWYVTRTATPSSENVRAVEEATLVIRTLKALLTS